MTPTRQNPRDQGCSSPRGTVSKGDTRMGRICSIATAILLLTASWVCAGNFELLADAGVVRPPTPLYAAPGTVVKAEFKSNIRTVSDTELESDSLLPEPVSGKEGVKAKPAIAYKERSRGMAPPPQTAPKSEDTFGATAQTREEINDLEADLEKDLVLSPPPPKTEEKAESTTKVIEKKPAEKAAVTEKKPEKKAAAQVRKINPDRAPQYTAQNKPIQKVKPASIQNPWHVAAGSHVQRPVASAPAGRMCNVSECPVPNSQVAYRQYREPNSPSPAFMTSDPRRVPVPPGSDRFVRDGVTIKLAPAAAPANALPYPEEESAGSDLISAAAEIIGMPFAFISSFF
ncbi:hypothetical protein Desti_4056 [Desulfomonile tiedjei DSM 6799]|uniref:Uncharacterized protein n=2 Tax=Desulfomonile tiedjei TaxID=2358 RepID=I4CAV4_DESTA|nr:hypothetical protein Desti_4056 [Desulfomonile tiedjei DSM 6799]